MPLINAEDSACSENEEGFASATTLQLSDLDDEKKTQRDLRRRATLTVRDLDEFRKCAPERQDPDELAWAIQQAENLELELRTAELRNPNSKRSQHDNELAAAIFKAKRCLGRWETSMLPPTLQDCSLSPSSSASVPLRMMPKVPEIPSFSGSNWKKFWGMFAPAIHEQPYLSNVEKMVHLISLLTGPAADLAEGLEITEKSYAVLIDLLRRRFDRPDNRRNELLRSLLASVPLTLKSTNELRRGVDRLVTAVRELSSLGVDADQFSVIIVPQMERILPKPWAERWTRKRLRDDRCRTLEHLLDFLSEEMEIQETMSLDFAPKDSSEKTFPKYKPSTTVKTNAARRDTTTLALPASVVPSSGSVSPRTCPACQGQAHSLARCDAFLRLSPQDRSSLVQRSRTCFNCLGPHLVSRCHSSFSCRSCHSRHHTLLCFKSAGAPAVELKGVTTGGGAVPKGESPRLAGSEVGVSMGGGARPVSARTARPMDSPPRDAVSLVNPGIRDDRGESQSLLNVSAQLTDTYAMTAVCFANGPAGSRRVRILFDTGADTSFIRKDVADSLGLAVTEQKRFICIGFQGTASPPREHLRVSCDLVSQFGGEPRRCHLWILENLSAPLKRKKIPPHPEINSLFLADDLSGGPVDIIIGNDQFYSFVLGGVISLSPALRAIQTSLGWVFHGRGDSITTQDAVTLGTISLLRASISTHWELEGLGIQPEPEETFIRCHPYWNASEGKIECPLLWKGEERPIANFQPVHSRTTRMESRLNLSQRVLYDDFMKSKLDDRVIAAAPPEWGSRESQFFLPHRGIFEGKFRVVFDGSARDGIGKPLNSYLHVGPNLLPKVLTILLQFRVFPVGLQADVKAAFHMIQLPEQDMPYVQFLYKGEILHFRRHPFGLVCAPHALHSSIEFLLEDAAKQPEFNEDVINTLKNGLYFDDEACGFLSVKAAREGAEQGTMIYDRYGLTLHKIRVSGDNLPSAMLLGLMWDTVDDSLAVRLPPASTPRTKKALLSWISSIWDPLGILTPWSIKGKFLFQKTWETALAWDDALPLSLADEATRWIMESTHSEPPPFPRICALPPFKLECFVDASMIAYCAVLYLSGSDGIRRLLVSKTRLAPLKNRLSIPRLELLAALIGVRLCRSVLGSLPVSHQPQSVRYFSDSQDVLFWLQRRRPLKLFVANRVKEILELSSVDDWTYISTADNPADLGTRGLSLRAVIESNLWWSGPASISSIPFSSIQPSPEALSEEKLIPSSVEADLRAETAVLVLRKEPAIDFRLAPENVGSLRRLLPVTAWIRRFANNCRKSPEERQMSARLLPEELEESRLLWIRLAQLSAFREEISCLESGVFIPKSSPLKLCRPFLSTSGLLLITPRNGEPPVIALPKSAAVTRLIILDAHQRTFHQGTCSTAALLAADYHISRSVVKGVVSDCRTCRRFRGLPYRSEESPLPAFRTEYSRCFARVGVDFFGPLYLSQGRKVFCLLITCSTIRAIHLELVSSQTAQDTALALRRFFALRGEPAEIMSDNAKTFRLLAKIIPSHIRWRFIPERAAWWGGFWERLVQMTKRVLKTVLHLLTLSFEELQTVLHETSMVLNQRPLIKSGSDDSPLTPAMFLFGVPSIAGVFRPPVPELGASLSRIWTAHRRVALHLQSRWKQEYFRTLRQWRQNRRGHPFRYPRPGDVVLIHQDNRNRSSWPIGVVESLIQGTNGVCRAAYVRVGKTTTRRPIEKLFELEASPLTTREPPEQPLEETEETQSRQPTPEAVNHNSSPLIS